MPLIKFRDWEPRTSVSTSAAVKGEKLSDYDKVQWAVKIVSEYRAQQLTLTLRQLYYQFVARALIPNTEKSYDSFGGLLSKARYAGLVDWDAIEDRGREASVWRQYTGPRDLIESNAWSYRLDRWKGQNTYVELWVEKQALSGVISPIAAEFHTPFLAVKGFGSSTALFEASRRYRRRGAGRDLVLLYLGDHDPSGEDMVRDIRDRLHEFGATVDVRKLALTMAQVEEYNPPPNPAKMTDSRAAGYVDKHGASSWEVDALPPDVLRSIIRKEMLSIIEMDKMNAVKAVEQRHIALLRQAALDIEDKVSIDDDDSEDDDE